MESRPRRITSFRRALIIMSLLLGIAGCTPTRNPLYSASGTHRYGAAFLTRDGGDFVQVQAVDTGVHTQALPSNEEGNTRVAFWPTGVDAVTDGESCASWTNRDGELVQQGAALRITRAHGRVRAVTVTQNIMFGAGWIFNVHTWDTARTSEAFRSEGSINLSSTFFADGAPPLPWSFCARVIGDTVEMKLWAPADETEPAWGDDQHGGSVTLPAGWRSKGQVGWYVGHLRAADQADFVAATTWTYDPQPATGRVTATS